MDKVHRERYIIVRCVAIKCIMIYTSRWVRYILNWPEQPLFTKYRRDWLHEQTGYSKGYLCRVATGGAPLSRAFIERVCFNLRLPESELFLPDPSETEV